METKEKRIVNFRPIFFCFVGLILGIVCTVLAFKASFAMLIAILTIMLIISTFIIIGVFVKIKFFKWFAKSSKFFFCISLSIVIGGSACYLQVKQFTDVSKNNRSYEISGRICEVSDYDTGFVGVILENCKANGNNLNKNIYVMCYGSEAQQFEVGDNLTFTNRISCVNILPNEKYVNDFYVNSNIGYISTLNASEIELSQGKLNFDEQVRKKVEDFLSKNMGADAAGIAIAVLLGEKSELNEMTKSYFSTAGIAHLLAISGLHVGFLVALLYFILKKLKFNKYVIFSLITIILIFYCYICGFPSSVVRASIMSIIFLFATTFGERSDSLTNLSVAGIILLLINPLQIFNLGFQLSFCCVFGIICLYKTFFTFFEKIKIPKIINAPMSICLICQISTLPLILNNFEFISALGLIANLICIPLFSFAFCFLILATVLGIIYSGFSFLLFVPEILFTIISGIAQFIAGINVGIYKFISFSLASILLFIVVIFLLSKYTMLKTKVKSISNLCIIFLFMLISVITSLPTKFSETNLIFAESLDNTTIVTTQNNNKILINIGTKGAQSELENLTLFLNNYKIYFLDAVVLVEYKTNIRNNLINICKIYNVDKLYLPNLSEADVSNIKQSLLNTQIIILEDNQIKNFNDANFALHYYNNIPKALEVNVKLKKIVFTSTSITLQEANFIKQTFNGSIDILRVNNYNKSMLDCELKGNITIANNVLAVPIWEVLNLKIESGLMLRVKE